MKQITVKTETEYQAKHWTIDSDLIRLTYLYC